jgi:hypothetical protein
MGDSLLAALMMIDINGPDSQAEDRVKTLILEAVNAWRNYKKRVTSRSSAGVTRPTRNPHRDQRRSNVY